MPDFHASHIMAVCLGIALSASCGFRVFIPLLAGALGAHYNLFTTPESMSWLGSWASVITFGVASIVEIGAYYIPVIDNALDFIGAPVAMGAGTLLASSILPVYENEAAVRWILAIIAGGGAAGTLHLGNGILRLLSTKLSLGTGNAAVATTENAAAIGASVMSFFTPILVAVVMCVLFFMSLIFIAKRLFTKKKTA